MDQRERDICNKRDHDEAAALVGRRKPAGVNKLQRETWPFYQIVVQLQNVKEAVDRIRPLSSDLSGSTDFEALHWEFQKQCFEVA